MSLIRYQKHIKLKSFGKDGQDKLTKSKVLIIGAGGLGTPASQYLNGIGVGTIGLMDNDVIDHSNLARQTLFNPSEVDRQKTEVLVQKLQQQNPDTKLMAIQDFLTPENALETIAGYDLVIDASDNFGTRYLVNDACVILDKPFIYGALHDFEGQVSVLNYKGGPTYRCLFQESDQNHMIPNCDENGILGVLPALIGTYQAIEAVKVLTGIGEPLSGKLLIIDTLAQTHLKIGVPVNPENKNINKLKDHYKQPVCANKTSFQEIKPEEFLARQKDKDGFQLIDVRSEVEFRLGHLNNATNIPLQEIQHRYREFSTKTPILLVCQSGKRSLQAAQLLQKAQADLTIFNLQGGMNQLNAFQENKLQ